MSHRVLSVVGGSCVAAWLIIGSLAVPSLAQTPDAKPAEQPAAAADNAKDAGKAGAKEPQKIDEYAEAQRLMSGPAGDPECVWLGRRVVSLLWRDDLDTAFRHLDLYDRFGCPGGHIQASFRCLVLHSGAVDSKAPDSLNSQVHACWINPSLQAAAKPAAAAPAPAAAASSPTTNR